MSVATRVPDDFHDIKLEVHRRRARGGPTAKSRSKRSSREEGGDYSPPGSPPNLDKEPSVHQLYRSARNSFGGRLEPLAGLEVLDHPVKRSSSRVVAQDWQIEEELTVAGERTQERGEATWSKESFGRRIVRGVCDREREKVSNHWQEQDVWFAIQLANTSSKDGISYLIQLNSLSLQFGRNILHRNTSNLRNFEGGRTSSFTSDIKW